ncbi:MAG: metal ABC transporter permease [Eubacterium sp.]|nr:metal ABC transporter permease [Eubacterium sp.]
MLDRLMLYLSYSFVRYALIVGVLIALCSSLLGVTLVLKRYSFIGDGLSHVAFGAMSVATVMKLSSNTILVLPVTVLTAIILLRAGQKATLKGDAAIAMLSVSSLAVGYMLMNIFSGSSNVSGDVCSTLFGAMSILTLSVEQVWISLILSVAVVTIFILMYNRLFAVTFDENFVRASGMEADRYNTIIAVVIAFIIVLGMNLVGSLLISALVILPTLSAMRVMKNFRSVVYFSAISSVIAALFGMLISIFTNTPVGSTIVIVDMAVFIVCSIIGRVLNR